MNFKPTHKVLQEAQTELKMNRSLLEMLNGNTALEDIAKLREVWVEPLEQLVATLRNGGGQ